MKQNEKSDLIYGLASVLLMLFGAVFAVIVLHGTHP